MIDNAFAWAEKNGLTRKNVQHGEQEAKLVLSDDFEIKLTEGESTHQQQSFEIEDT